MLDTFHRKEEFGRNKTPGSTAYPEVKTDGDKSMPLKQKMPEDVYGIVLQDPRDRVKAILPEPQSPTMQLPISRQQRLMSGTSNIRRYQFRRRNLPVGGVVRNDLTQGDERGTYVALTRLALKERGIAYGARALWRRSLRSSRGSNAPLRRAGESLTGQREAGVYDATGKGGTRDA
jgi:hypothetical protein